MRSAIARPAGAKPTEKPRCEAQFRDPGPHAAAGGWRTITLRTGAASGQDGPVMAFLRSLLAVVRVELLIGS